MRCLNNIIRYLYFNVNISDRLVLLVISRAIQEHASRMGRITVLPASRSSPTSYTLSAFKLAALTVTTATQRIKSANDVILAAIHVKGQHLLIAVRVEKASTSVIKSVSPHVPIARSLILLFDSVNPAMENVQRVVAI